MRCSLVTSQGQLFLKMGQLLGPNGVYRWLSQVSIQTKMVSSCLIPSYIPRSYVSGDSTISPQDLRQYLIETEVQVSLSHDNSTDLF